MLAFLWLGGCTGPATPTPDTDSEATSSTDTTDTGSPAPSAEDCANGVDDDGDGLLDCEDGDCFDQCVETQCDDLVDDDGDGVADCLDDDCALDVACRPQTLQVLGGSAHVARSWTRMTTTMVWGPSSAGSVNYFYPTYFTIDLALSGARWTWNGTWNFCDWSASVHRAYATYNGPMTSTWQLHGCVSPNEVGPHLLKHLGYSSVWSHFDGANPPPTMGMVYSSAAAGVPRGPMDFRCPPGSSTYLDHDGDGLGGDAVGCPPGGPFASNSHDCNDLDPSPCP